MILDNKSFVGSGGKGKRKSFRVIKRIRREEELAELKHRVESGGRSTEVRNKPTLPVVAWLAKDDAFREEWRRKYGG